MALIMLVTMASAASITYYTTDVVIATVTDATNATPIVVTVSADHGYATGDRVNIASVGGNTAANAWWIITVTDTDEFSLDGSVGNGAYTSGGVVNPVIRLTSDSDVRCDKLILNHETLWADSWVGNPVTLDVTVGASAGLIAQNPNRLILTANGPNLIRPYDVGVYGTGTSPSPGIAATCIIQ